MFPKKNIFQYAVQNSFRENGYEHGIHFGREWGGGGAGEACAGVCVCVGGGGIPETGIFREKLPVDAIDPWYRLCRMNSSLSTMNYINDRTWKKAVCISSNKFGVTTLKYLRNVTNIILTYWRPWHITSTRVQYHSSWILRFPRITVKSYGWYCVLNHWQLYWSFNSVFMLKSKNTLKLRITGPFFEGVHWSPVTHKWFVMWKAFPYHDAFISRVLLIVANYRHIAT